MNVKDLIGRPKFDSGQFLGYLLWKQSDGFHLRWSKKGTKEYYFEGKIISETRIAQKLRIGTTDRLNESENRTIEWNTKKDEKMDGVDFLTGNNFKVELKINKKKVKPKNIFLGPKMINPEKNPFTVTGTVTEIQEPIYKPKPEPVYEPESEPTYEPEPEPTYEPEPEPTYEPEPEPEPVYELEPEPTYEPEPEPTYEPEPEPTYEPEPEPTYEPEPEPTHEPEPEPTYEPEPEPESESEPKFKPEQKGEPESNKGEEGKDPEPN